MSTYRELLNHPRWQRKAAETKARAGWKCQWCGSTEKPLNAHHGYYEFGRAPWEYEDASLFSLCDECHKRAGLLQKKLKYSIGHLHPRAYEFVDERVQGLVEFSDDRGLPKHRERKVPKLTRDK